MSGDFDVDLICEDAAREVGHDDFGSDSFRRSFDPLVYSAEHEADLNERGRAEMRSRIVAALANRLTVVAWEKAHPGLVGQPIVAPIVILGMPRTGSTILHETLSTAPGMRSPMTWEVTDFALAHDVDDPRSDPRVIDIDAAIALENERVPDYAAIHYSDAFVPMECVALTIIDLVSVQFPSMAHLPTYREYLVSMDARETYQWHRRALVYFQSARKTSRWVLKAPAHSLYLRALEATYPDARLVYTHRDPRKVIGSVCSLYETLRAPWSDTSDLAVRARSDLDYTATACVRATEYRAERPDLDQRIHDVSFTEFMRDQRGTLGQIDKALDLGLRPEAHTAMADYLENRPREKYGKHRYSLDHFGIDDADVRDHFARYLGRYSDFLA